MSNSQHPARQRNIFDYNILDNDGRSRALIYRPLKPTSSAFNSLNTNSNIDLTLNPTLKSALNSSRYLINTLIYLNINDLLVNAYINSSNSNTNYETFDSNSNLQLLLSNINLSKSILQIELLSL
jgi:hypothetical protein